MIPEKVELHCQKIDGEIDILRRELSALKRLSRAGEIVKNPIETIGKKITGLLEELVKIKAPPKKNKTKKNK